MMNVEDYFFKYSVLDGMGNMDGAFVPLGIAMLGVEQVLQGKILYDGRRHIKTCPNKKSSVQALIDDQETYKKIDFVLNMAKDSLKRQRAEPCSTGSVEQIVSEYQSIKIKELEEISDILKDYHERTKN